MSGRPARFGLTKRSNRVRYLRGLRFVIPSAQATRGRAAAGPDHDRPLLALVDQLALDALGHRPSALGPRHDVGDQEHVVRLAALGERLELELDVLDVVGVGDVPAALEALVGQPTQVRFGGHVLGDPDRRHLLCAVDEEGRGPAGGDQGVADRLVDEAVPEARVVLVEHGPDLGRGLVVEGIDRELVDVLAFVALLLPLLARLVGGDHQEHVLRRSPLLGRVVLIERGHDGDAVLDRQPRSLDVGRPLLVDVVGHELHEQVLAEDPAELADPGLGLALLLGDDALAELAADAARVADEPLAVSLEQLVVDASLAVEARPVGLGDDGHEALPAARVLGVERQVVVGLEPLLLTLDLPVRAVVDLAPDDGHDPTLAARAHVVQRAGERPVVGERQGGVARGLGRLDVLLGRATAVEEAVLAVRVEARDQLGHRRAPRICLRWAIW